MLVKLSVVPIDLKTRQPITSAKVGSQFGLCLVVQDLRPDGTFVSAEGMYAGQTRDLIRGVFAAYCDIHFDLSKVQVIPNPKFINSVSFDPLYTNGKSACAGPGGIRYLGAFTSSYSGLSTDPYTVCTVQMKAIHAGRVCFTPVINSLIGPAWDVLVFANLLTAPPEDQLVSKDQVVLVSSVLTVS